MRSGYYRIISVVRQLSGGGEGGWALCLRRVISSTFISLLKTLAFWISTREIEAAISSFGNYIDGNVI
jgi:hypothetical protein